MAKRVTMQDIADRLNISKNSVSQALSGKPGVSEETRKQIYQMADELGYRYTPRITTTTDTPSESGKIALIASDFAFSLESFFGEIYLSVEREVHRHDKTLLIQSVSQQARDELILPSFIEDRSVDGVLVLSHISNAYINKVIATGIPTVLIDHHHPTIQTDAILTNNRFGAYTAVQHLIELGHEDITFVGNIDFSPSYQERLEGYQLALKDYGIQPKEEFIFSDAEEDDQMINNYIAHLSEQPTAWFCVNDGLGYLVNSGLKLKDIQVPEQASVVSFDDGQLSRLSTPRITTMGINLPLFGKKALDQLFWRMENSEEPYQETLLPANLIKRESTSYRPGYKR
ncbi:LacI family DNA-binding transcriptional regulator [Alkalihalobacillus sp. TS-13]|uniref:LacI family DNA-binding transcriptional regulator n=1 Tax=Alkalihalobacillus sp. TS-13 TaxID=2842455 RepID=UPI001C88E11D|nr:LacI family DNA-binding transcriptional regulator [Alkalihalobacillus sp. TS-13]